MTNLSEPTVGRLLYVAFLGGTSPRRRRAQSRLVQRTLDAVAERSPEHLVRLVSLGNGLTGQSPIGQAIAFRSARRGLRKRPRPSHDWPKASGQLDLIRSWRELLQLAERDVEQAAYEGTLLSRIDCVCVPGRSPSVAGAFGSDYTELASRMGLTWISDPPDAAVPVQYAVPGATVVETHPELVTELMRLLDLPAPRMSGPVDAR